MRFCDYKEGIYALRSYLESLRKLLTRSVCLREKLIKLFGRTAVRSLNLAFDAKLVWLSFQAETGGKGKKNEKTKPSATFKEQLFEKLYSAYQRRRCPANDFFCLENKIFFTNSVNWKNPETPLRTNYRMNTKLIGCFFVGRARTYMHA